MNLIQPVENTKVLALLELVRLVQRYVYEQEKMTVDECNAMYKGIGDWGKRLKWLRDNQLVLSPNETQEEYILERACFMIQKRETGGYEDLLKMFKENNIDWKKWLRLPGAYTEADLARAEQVYADYAKKNPEQEGIAS